MERPDLQNHAASIRVPRILLGDEDVSVRLSLEELLRGERYDVVVAANGREVRELFSQSSVDGVILDLNIPAKEGWATFQALMTASSSRPIIFITGEPNQQAAAAQWGGHALMEKPLDLARLLELLKLLVEAPIREQVATGTSERRFIHVRA